MFECRHVGSRTPRPVANVADMYFNVQSRCFLRMTLSVCRLKTASSVNKASEVCFQVEITDVHSVNMAFDYSDLCNDREIE